MKAAIITGASRGVGFALTKKFLKEGYRVVAAARSFNHLSALQEDHPYQLFLLELDLTSPMSIEKFSNQIKSLGITIDVVVHNAGHLVNKPFLEIAYQDILSSYSVNVFGPFQLTQCLYPALSNSAHIVFISSMGGVQGSQKFPGLTAYSPAKAAEAALAECLQEEFKNTNLSFNTICLGAVQTEMLSEAFPGYLAPHTPEQISEFIFSFCHEANKYLRGKIIPVSLSNP